MQAPSISTQIENYSRCGILEQATSGLVYLKIDKRYVDGVLPLLKQQEGDLKNPKELHLDSVGAHITVMTLQESCGKNIVELGESFCFSVEGLYAVRAGKKKFYYLKVASDALQNLREKYGLPAQYEDHDLHITVAWQKAKED